MADLMITFTQVLRNINQSLSEFGNISCDMRSQIKSFCNKLDGNKQYKHYEFNNFEILIQKENDFHFILVTNLRFPRLLAYEAVQEIITSFFSQFDETTRNCALNLDDEFYLVQRQIIEKINKHQLTQMTNQKSMIEEKEQLSTSHHKKTLNKSSMSNQQYENSLNMIQKYQSQIIYTLIMKNGTILLTDDGNPIGNMMSNALKCIQKVNISNPKGTFKIDNHNYHILVEKDYQFIMISEPNFKELNAYKQLDRLKQQLFDRFTLEYLENLGWYGLKNQFNCNLTESLAEGFKRIEIQNQEKPKTGFFSSIQNIFACCRKEDMT